jgi:hypothetical protein
MEFNWAELGVNVGVIGAIIAIVQMIKQWIPEKLVVWVPIVLSAAAKFIVAPEQPVEFVFYWAAASAYLWKIANTLTPPNILKSKDELSK